MSYTPPTEEEWDAQREAHHQCAAHKAIQYNQLVAVTNDHNDLLVALIAEGMETLNRVLTKAIENKEKGVGNALRVSNPHFPQ